MLNLVKDVKMNAVNLMKVLSFGENDLRNGRIYSNEEVKNEMNFILAENN